MKPKDLARCIVDKYGTRNPFRLAECLDITVMELGIGRNVKGIILRYEGWFYTCLNRWLCEHEKRIVLAHEIGHAVCHAHLNYFFLLEHTLFPPGKFERQANEFAAELLISDEELWEVREERAEYAARALGVTEELLVLKQISTF